jgi:hypothetical protein
VRHGCNDKETSMADAASTLIPHYTVDEVARRYEELGIPGDRPPEANRLTIRVLRAISEGMPVTPERVREMAPSAGLTPDAAVEMLANVAERDGDGNIIGLMGLTQNHGFDIHFRVGEHKLRTWCALDSLFLPLLLDREAVVESGSALRGEPVRFTVGPDGVSAVEPAEAVVSLVIPSSTARKGITKTEIRGLVAEQGSDADVELVHVHTNEEAQALRFVGSPTVRIDGRDVDPDTPGEGYNLECRLYWVDGRPRAKPPRKWIADAMRDSV